MKTKPKKSLYIIQKVIQAHSIEEALRNERKGRVVEVVLSAKSVEKLDSAIGFIYNTQGEDFGDEEE